jgi:hypothetical protein
MNRLLIIAGAACAAFLAAGCGSTSASAPSGAAATPTSAPTVAPTIAATPAPADPLVAWCHLSLGEAKAAALATMPAPSGNQAAPYLSLLSPGESAVEWDVSGDILLATFSSSGMTSDLQAYPGHIGTAGATNLSCAAFRPS